MVEKKSLSWYNFILVAVIIISVGLIVFQNIDSITGHATTGSTESSVTITQYLSIDMSGNLTGGISFGSQGGLSTTVNASENHNGTSDSTLYFINVSSDSNTNVDFCTKASGDLSTAGADIITLANETYSNSTSSNSTSPIFGDKVVFTNAYVKTGQNITKGTPNYYRFWLYLPPATPTGTYNNTVYFEAVNTLSSCS